MFGILRRLSKKREDRRSSHDAHKRHGDQMPHDLDDGIFWSFLFDDERSKAIPNPPIVAKDTDDLKPKVVESTTRRRRADRDVDDGCFFGWVDYCLCSLRHGDDDNEDEELVGKVIVIETPRNDTNRKPKSSFKKRSVFGRFRKRKHKKKNSKKMKPRKPTRSARHKETVKSFSSFSYSESGSDDESSSSESDDSSTLPPESFYQTRDDIDQPKERVKGIRTMTTDDFSLKKTAKSVLTGTTGTTSKMSHTLSKYSGQQPSSQLSKSRSSSSYPTTSTGGGFHKAMQHHQMRKRATFNPFATTSTR